MKLRIAIVAAAALCVLASVAAIARADGGDQSGARTASSTMSPCTRAHPCANPGCAAAGYSPGDCYPTTTTETTTTTGSTSDSPCTRAHPCANPACAAAGYGPGDCYTPTTTTTPTETTPAAPVTPPAPAAPSTPSAPVQPVVTPPATPTPAPPVQPAQPFTPPALPAGGVAGGSTTASKPAETPMAAGGVLGAKASLTKPTAVSGTLPFTGMPLWPAVAGGVLLLLAGMYLRRRAGVH